MKRETEAPNEAASREVSTEMEVTFGPENPARILPLVAGSGDRELLSNWISEQPEYEVVPVDPESPTLTDAEMDLCILDKAALRTYAEELQSRKKAAAPIQLPFLLLYPDDDPTVLDIDKGELADSVLRETVDEIVSLPLKKTVLAWRVEALLRVRAQSLELEREKQEMKRFKQAVDSAGPAIYMTDSNGIIEYVNPAFERITGYGPGEAVGEDLRLLNSGEMSPEYFDELWETVTSGELWHGEVINERSDGELYHAEQTIAPILGPEGEIDSYVAIHQDITRRKRERRKLEQYKQGVESAIDLLAAVDTDLEFLYANEKYCHYHDVDPDRIEGKPIREVLGEDTFAEVKDPLNAVLDGKERKLEVKRESSDIGERILEEFLFPILDEDGSVRGVGASIRDITEPKEHERHLETLVSNLPGIVYRCASDPGWPIEMVRGRSQELTGYTAEEIEADSFHWTEDIVHPDDQEMVTDELMTALEADEPFERTYRIVTRSGETKWVRDRGREVMPVGAESPKLEGFITDITERKQLQEDLLESKEQYESLFTSIRDAILVADTDRQIINCNPAFTDLFEYELSEIYGKPTSYIYESKAESEEMRTALSEHMGDPEFTQTASYEKKSGQTFEGETNVFYLENADGEALGFIGIIRDISNKQDRMTQLQVIDRVLRHNFKNDVNVIQGFAEQIEREATPSLAEHAKRIRTTSADMLETVEKEREATKLLSEPPPIRTVDLSEIITRVVDAISADYPEADISAETEEEHLVKATERIERAIEELVMNSIVHSDAQTPSVTVGVGSTEEYSTIVVSDENPPIPEMERQVLTKNEDQAQLYHGSGMGLWLVSLIVNFSDGILEFEASEQQGNILKIRLQSADVTQ